jgi:hypothetical protein
MAFDPKTQYFDENGKPLKLSDLRAGDTVRVKMSGGARPTTVSIHKGQLTIAEPHRYYLDCAEIKKLMGFLAHSETQRYLSLVPSFPTQRT